VTAQPAAGDTHDDPLTATAAEALCRHVCEWYELDMHVHDELAARLVAALRPHIDAEKQAAAAQALKDAATDLRSLGYEPAPKGYAHFDCEDIIASHLDARADEIA